MAQNQQHFLLITYPVQGHINPALQFAKRLIQVGVKVTVTVTVSAYRKMSKAGRIPECFNFVVFSDSLDDGFNPNTHDQKLYKVEFRERGTQSLKQTIFSSAEKGTPVTCLVYTLLLPWVAEVARSLSMPSALLWIQPASLLRIYYYYFNGYDKLIGNHCDEASWCIEIPGLPSLKSRDLPSLFVTPNEFILNSLKEQLDMLVCEEKPKILVNSFDALEEEALKEIDGKLQMIAIGPLFPSDKSLGGDLFETTSKNYVDEWMNTKPQGSIVYVSFGSLVVLTKKQKEAMARGLLQSGRPFVWVIRKDKDYNTKGEDDQEKLTSMEELEQLGLIVPWCRQLQVLSHPSLGCFVTHCGWNSTLESIACGVPVVAFPQGDDQTTNAKLLQDLWETGVRVTTSANEDGVVDGEEIRKCIEMVMTENEKGATVRNNAKKWKELATKAMKESGSSCMNIKAFLKELNGS